MSSPAWPHAWPPSEHCYSHGAHEPIPEGDFWGMCGECGHVYLTERDVVDAYVKEAPPGSIGPAELKGADILFCPYCMHDF